MPLYSSSESRSFPLVSVGALTLTVATAAYLFKNGSTFDVGALKLCWFRRANTNTTPTLPAKTTRRQTLEQQQHDLLEEGIVVKPIGAVRSIYRLCVGTPRQGLLAPNARGRIELTLRDDSVVEGLQEYSHIWVVFVFHLNTVGSSKPSKIAPPALGGSKVGVLATRSPHRPNPIGMTLCQLDSIEYTNKRKAILYISGMDLVDGTPVLDIKPFVPHYDADASAQTPTWVSKGLETARRVIIAPQAVMELQVIVSNHQLEFYGRNNNNESWEEAMEAVMNCIQQVLSVDVRSPWQTNKARRGNSKAERAQRLQPTGETSNQAQQTETSTPLMSTQQLDNMLLYYSVKAPSETVLSTSQGSGAEDVVTVHSIHLMANVASGAEESTSSSPPLTTVPSSHEDEDYNYDESMMQRNSQDNVSSPRRRDMKRFQVKSSPIRPPQGGDYTTISKFWKEAATMNGTPDALAKPDEYSMLMRKFIRLGGSMPRMPLAGDSEW